MADFAALQWQEFCALLELLMSQLVRDYGSFHAKTQSIPNLQIFNEMRIYVY